MLISPVKRGLGSYLERAFFTLVHNAQIWCVGKQWWWRALLLAWFGVVFIGLLKDPANTNVFGPLNLCIHEMGHLIFSWAWQFLAVAGGTLVQLAAPMYGLWNFYRIRDFFAMALCLGWLSTNLFNVAHYMADARSMQLDLVSLGGGENTIHDWNYLLGHTGLLPLDHVLAGLVWLCAVCIMLACFIAGTWLIWQMITLKNPQSL